MHGMYRSTADIDLLADIKPEQVRPLLDALEKSFYIDEVAVRQAVAQRQSFNAIHFDSVFKVDIFIPKADDFARKQLERRELRRLLRRSTSSFMLQQPRILFWQNSAGIGRAMRLQATSGLTFWACWARNPTSWMWTTCASGRISSELEIFWRRRFYLSRASFLTQGTHKSLLPSFGQH